MKAAKRLGPGGMHRSGGLLAAIALAVGSRDDHTR